MFRLFGEAWKLFRSHFVALVILVLAVRLPINAVTEWFYHTRPAPQVQNAIEHQHRLDTILSAFFDPLWVGAVLWWLHHKTRGEAVSIGAAYKQAFDIWGRLLLARWVAGFFVLLGLLLLIVPGLVLWLRYYLLDCAVVLEGAGVSESRKRSGELTQGRKLSIAGAVLLSLVLGFLVYASAYFTGAIGLVMAGFSEEAVNHGTAVAFSLDLTVDCVFDVFFVLLTLLALVVYQQATTHEPAEAPAAAGPGMGYLACPNPQCRQLNPPGVRYCPRCGTAY